MAQEQNALRKYTGLNQGYKSNYMKNMSGF
jgi:hypothetical protein